VAGSVGGRQVIAGSTGLLVQFGVEEGALAALSDELAQAGQTPVLVAADGQPLGVIGLLDELRPGAAEAVARLTRMGIEVHLLTGDRQRAARAIGAQLGIAPERIHAEVLPENKVAEVALRKQQGQVVAMVGDGVNDAPALAEADVGIAVGGGADVALEAAPLVLMRPEPALVADAIALSREGLKTIRQNLYWAFGYNVVAIPLAAAGMLSPMLGSGAMAFSSVSVVANSLRLRRRRLAG
jgi:Cu+-exporting ATPase